MSPPENPGIRRIVEDLGCEVATLDEAREVLAL